MKTLSVKLLLAVLLALGLPACNGSDQASSHPHAGDEEHSHDEGEHSHEDNDHSHEGDHDSHGDTETEAFYGEQADMAPSDHSHGDGENDHQH